MLTASLTYVVMSAELSFIIDRPLICKTEQKYIDQSVNIGVRLFSFNTSSINQLIADWSFENMNTDVKPYGMSLGVSV